MFAERVELFGRAAVEIGFAALIERDPQDIAQIEGRVPDVNYIHPSTTIYISPSNPHRTTPIKVSRTDAAPVTLFLFAPPTNDNDIDHAPSIGEPARADNAEAARAADVSII